MQMNTSRRGFLKSVAGAAAVSATGAFTTAARPFTGGKVRLAAVGVMGKGLSDWVPMLKSGKAELVALCDCDKGAVAKAAKSKAFRSLGSLKPDLSKVKFFDDYRKLLDEADALGIQAMTVSTTDHTHAAIAIPAMKKGIHVYVQKPLVRTLGELEYFESTAKKYGVITQMGNQGSSLEGFRRGVEVLRSGILGDVTEVHVWTNRPVWPQGVAAGKVTMGAADQIPANLNWDTWLGPAKDRNYKHHFPKDSGVYNPWKIAHTVYHPFNWRGFFDFGCVAFGDMACHTMNLPFRGLELSNVLSAELVKIEDRDTIAYPMKSVVKLVYASRTARFSANKGKTLPEVTLFWYDGNVKPSKSIMPEVAAAFKGRVPNTGCVVIGTKGILCSTNDYGGDSFVAIKGVDKKVINIKKHEACKAVAHTIPYRSDSVNKVEKAAGAAAVSADGHYVEFLDAIRGEGPKFADVGNSRCFSDIEYSIPQMEGILVGCAAQRVCEVGQKICWNSSKQKFDNAAANALIKPYMRKGFEF
jgi:predicted dehydrogenase